MHVFFNFHLYKLWVLIKYNSRIILKEAIFLPLIWTWLILLMTFLSSIILGDRSFKSIFHKDAIEVTINAPGYRIIMRPTLRRDFEEDKMPSSAKSKDGEIWFDLIGYDSKTMNVTVDNGKLLFDQNKIVGISSGEIVKLTISLKDGRTWLSGRSDPVIYELSIKFKEEKSSTWIIWTSVFSALGVLAAGLVAWRIRRRLKSLSNSVGK